MVVIEIKSVHGRWHATPWGHQVNEGQVEWPPSPWRLLRALIATWHQKSSHDIELSALQTLVEALSSVLPSFFLPPATLAHTRHYMPLYQSESRTQIIDAFAHLKEGTALYCIWPCALSEQSRGALSQLLSRITYLGRAESWIEARLLDEQAASAITPNAVPLFSSVSTDSADTSNTRQPMDIVRVLAPVSAQEYCSWKEKMLSEKREQLLVNQRTKLAGDGKNPEKAKLTKKQQEQLDQSLPVDLFSAMAADNIDWQKQRWSQPPGSQWIDYARPRDVFSFAPQRQSRRSVEHLPTVARFAVSSSVLPRLTDALPFAEKVRSALLSQSDSHPIFLGRGEDGLPAHGHEHVFILPEASASHGQISFVTLYCQQGFDDAARVALERLRKVWGHGGHDVFFVLLGLGSPEEFAGFNRTAGQCALLETSRFWRSYTPFVPTRHPKTRNNGSPKCDETGLQIGSPEHDLRRLLQEQGCPEILSLSGNDGLSLAGHFTSWLEFCTIRRKGDGRRAIHRGFGGVIEFAEPYAGPLAVGYGAHFGLGLFEPIPNET